MLDIINQYQNSKKNNQSLLRLCLSITPYLEDIHAHVFKQCCQKVLSCNVSKKTTYNHTLFIYSNVKEFINNINYRNDNEDNFDLLMIATSIFGYWNKTPFNIFNEKEGINLFNKACLDGVLNGLSNYELHKVRLLILSLSTENKENIRNNNKCLLSEQLEKNNIMNIARIMSKTDLKIKI